MLQFQSQKTTGFLIYQKVITIYLGSSKCICTNNKQFMFVRYLVRPSKSLLSVTKILKSIFHVNFDKEKCIVQRLANKMLTIIPKYCIPLEVLLCIVRTRLYIHLRELNRTEQEKSFSKCLLNKNKLKKFVK